MRNYCSDIIVIGAGLAGVCAAISAKRQGRSVLLIEKFPFAGGMATGAEVHSMLTFHGGFGHKIIGGLPEEIIGELKKEGGTCGHVPDTIGAAFSVTPTDPYIFRLMLHKKLKKEGVMCLFNSALIDVKTYKNKIIQISGICPDGNFTACANAYVDASGEGILSLLAGCNYIDDAGGSFMPATLIFSVREVNLDKTIKYVLDNPEEFHGRTKFLLLSSSVAPGFSGFFSLWKNAGLNIPRDRILFYKTLNKDEVSVNSTRVINFNPFDPANVQDAYGEALDQAYKIFNFLKSCVPGFENCIVSRIASFLGIREGRRIKGCYVLTLEDVLNGKRFDDEVTFGGFPVDVHSPSGDGLQTAEIGGEGFYGIPYRCMIPENIKNLVFTGKCLSAEFSAHASARVQATAMALGEAAGVAAALSVEKKKEPAEIKPELLRKLLLRQKVILNPEKLEL